VCNTLYECARHGRLLREKSGGLLVCQNDVLNWLLPELEAAEIVVYVGREEDLCHSWSAAAMASGGVEHVDTLIPVKPLGRLDASYLNPMLVEGIMERVRYFAYQSWCIGLANVDNSVLAPSQRRTYQQSVLNKHYKVLP
jgi:hypothetical protein